MEQHKTSLVTKKDLEARFKLADTTVYRTLKACGLSTSRRSYTDEEIENQFKPARWLLNAGHTVAEVKKYFSLKAVPYENEKRPRQSIRHKP